MQGGQHQFTAFIRLQDAQVGDHGLRAAAAQAGCVSFGLPVQEAGRGAEIHLFREAAFLVRGDDVAAVGPGGDFHRAARAGQAHLGMVVIADHGGIDVAKAVDLRAAQKAHIHVAALQVEGEDIVHAAHRQRPADQGGVADGERQARRLGADHPGFVDHQQVGGVRAPGQVAGQVGQPHADKDHIAIAQQPGGVDGHQFRGRVFKCRLHILCLWT